VAKLLQSEPVPPYESPAAGFWQFQQQATALLAPFCVSCEACHHGAACCRTRERAQEAQEVGTLLRANPAVVG